MAATTIIVHMHTEDLLHCERAPAISMLLCMCVSVYVWCVLVSKYMSGKTPNSI